jgi:hypothetical protein
MSLANGLHLEKGRSGTGLCATARGESETHGGKQLVEEAAFKVRHGRVCQQAKGQVDPLVNPRDWVARMHASATKTESRGWKELL